MTEPDTQPPAQVRAGLPNVRFTIGYEDGTEQSVTTRPLDLAAAGVRVDQNLAATMGDPTVLLHLAFLAAGHDRDRAPYADRDAFAAVVVRLEWELEQVRPTNAARGNGSPSSWRLPPEPALATGSTPTPV